MLPILLNTEFEQPVSSVGERPGNDGVALLVVGVAVLQPSLGGRGTVAHPSPLALLLVVVLKLPCLATVFQHYTLQRSCVKIEYVEAQVQVANTLPYWAGLSSPRLGQWG